MRRVRVVALILTLAAGVSLAAQKPSTLAYDSERQLRLEGIVTRVEWVTPRAYVFLSVKDSSGYLTNWAVEIGNPLDLQGAGWNGTTVRIGDTLRVQGAPSRDPGPRMAATNVVLARTGKAVFTTPSRVALTLKQPAPRWPDGRVRLGPAPGKKGYWGVSSAKALVDEAGGRLALTDEGLLTNLADADRVAPFQPWAKALYLQRQRTRLRDDPSNRCMPPGGPRQFHTPNGFQFVEQREAGRILVLAGGGNRNWRTIHTDGRAQGQPAEVVLSYFGNSVGRWEGNDTLVVDSIGFNERFWMTNGGLPHTEALHLTERFTRVDLQTLRYEVTVDDPRAYTRPWKGGWTIQWVADKEIEEYFCEENVESTLPR